MSYEVRPTQLPRARILSDAGAAGTAPWQIVAQLLAQRYSCRGFLPHPVPHETIERLLALAQLSASWCNAQPWQVIVTEGAGTERFRQALYAHAEGDHHGGAGDFAFPARYEGVYQRRRRETAWQLFQAVGVEFGDRVASRRQSLQNFRLFGAPHVMIITTERDLGVYGAVDCGIYVGSILTVAQSLGLATIAQAALAGQSAFVKRFFGLPEHRRVVCAISFGYEDPQHAANQFRTTRAPQDEVATFVTE